MRDVSMCTTAEPATRINVVTHRARHEHSLNVHDGVRFTFSHVGTALWVTTLILVAGFAVLGFSSFKLNADLGILTAITLIFALVLDFLLLPPLLMLMDKEEQCSCATCQCVLPQRRNFRFNKGGETQISSPAPEVQATIEKMIRKKEADYSQRQSSLS